VKALLDRQYSPDGFNVGFNNGLAAGQTVPHFHIHVIPRYTGDVPDPRGGVRHVIPAKGNYLAAEASVSEAPFLVDNTDNRRMQSEIIRLLADRRFDHIDLLVSFIMKSVLG
jgi:diadenosine tetraphosphate (Ap4A) HIT family hydrolase